MLSLTSNQENIVESIIYEINHRKGSVRLVLCGYAGTGKTVSTAALIYRLKDFYARVVVATPTHKARAQVERALTENGASDFEAVTVHSLLGMKPVVDFDTGKESFVRDPNGKNKLRETRSRIGIVIVDEVSMLNSDLYHLLLEELGDRSVVFVGDDRQLLPVGEKEVCAAFKNADSTYRLSEVLRHDGAILNLATETRKQSVGRAQFTSAKGGGSEVVTYKDKSQWLNALLQISATPTAMRDLDFCRALAWTNEAVNDLNEKVHQWRYGSDAPMFKKGMTCLTVNAIANPEGGAPLLNSTVDVLIESAEYEQVTYSSDEEETFWNTWLLTVSSPSSDCPLISFRVIDKSDQESWKQELDSIANIAKKTSDREKRRELWKRFYARRDSVGFLQPNSAMTIHKSQGSTFKNVFLHWSIDIPKKDQNQLAYVGITRASETLHVLAD